MKPAEPTPSERFRVTMELFETGVNLMRQNLRRNETADWTRRLMWPADGGYRDPAYFTSSRTGVKEAATPFIQA